MIVADGQTLAAHARGLWGSEAVRLGTAGDTVGTLTPLIVLEPADAAALAGMLQWANTDRVAIVPRGAGTKLSWGAPPARLDAVLSTARLNAPVDHCAGDLTATIPAGCTLAVANALLARERQWLPLDPLYADRATIGGIVSTNDSGPRRHWYGPPRDLIIGIEMALTDGRRAKAGGRVVKNVAGYDLGRLLCGSRGTLAVITSVTFKLAPVAPVSRTVLATVTGFRHIGELALALGAAPLAPTAIEVDSSPTRLLIRFESTPTATREQTASAQQICERHGAVITSVQDGAERDLWRHYAAAQSYEDSTTIKVSVLPSNLASLLERADRAMSSRQIGWHASGRALGILLFSLTGTPEQQVDAVGELGGVVRELGGTTAVLSTTPAVWQRLERAVEIGDALPLMRSVKARFDPKGILSPGRGPGGL